MAKSDEDDLLDEDDDEEFEDDEDDLGDEDDDEEFEDGEDEADGEGDSDEAEEDTQPRIERERAVAFEKTLTQLQTFYQEMSIISAKKPDNAVNKFKLKLINETLVRANFVLGQHYRPFPEFETFREEDIPTASDVVLMLSHYKQGFKKFRDVYGRDHRWMVLDGKRYGDIIEDLPPSPDEKTKEASTDQN